MLRVESGATAILDKVLSAIRAVKFYIRERFASEKGIQNATIIRMNLSSEEHPVIALEDCLGGVNQAWFGKRRTV
jgi:hypothetical protein